MSLLVFFFPFQSGGIKVPQIRGTGLIRAMVLIKNKQLV